MIASFRSNQLKRFWTKGVQSVVDARWRKRVRIILSRLDAATTPVELNSPGLGFHRLTGDLAERYAVTVSRNWRITFAWDGDDAVEVDLEDYHG